MTGPFKTKAPKKSTSLVQQAKSIDNSPLSPRHPFVKNKESIDRSSSSSSVMRYISNGDLFKLEISELYVIPSTWSCANQSPITVSSLSITTIRQQMRRGSLKYKEYHLVPVTKTFINAKYRVMEYKKPFKTMRFKLHNNVEEYEIYCCNVNRTQGFPIIEYFKSLKATLRHPILRKTSNVVVFEETFSCSRQSSTLSLSQVVVIPTECFPREKEESVFLIDIWPKNPTTLAEDGEKRGKCGCYRASLEVRSMVKLEKEIFSIKSTEDEESDVHELNGDLRFETVMGEKDQSSFRDEEIHKESTVENDIVSTNYESDMENPAEKQSHSSSPKIDIDKGDGDLECHRFIFEDEKSLLLKEQGQSFSKCEMKTVSENPAEKQSRSSSPKIDIDKDDGDLECHRFIFEDEKSLLLKEQGQSFSKCEMKTVPENPDETLPATYIKDNGKDEFVGDDQCYRILLEGDESRLLREDGWLVSFMENEEVRVHEALEQDPLTFAPEKCFRFLLEGEHSILLQDESEGDTFCVPVAHNGPKHKFHDDSKSVFVKEDFEERKVELKEQGRHESTAIDSCYVFRFENGENILLSEEGHSWPENGFEVNIPSLCILEQHMNAVPDSEKHGQIHLIFKKDIENVSTIKCVSGKRFMRSVKSFPVEKWEIQFMEVAWSCKLLRISAELLINIQRTRLKSKCIQSSSEETISIDYRFGYDSFEDARRRNSNLKGETVNSGGDGPSLDKNPVQNNDLLAELYQVDKIYNDDLEDLPPIRVGAKSPFPRRKLARLIEYAIAFKEQKHEKYEKKCELDDVLIVGSLKDEFAF